MGCSASVECCMVPGKADCTALVHTSKLRPKATCPIGKQKPVPPWPFQEHGCLRACVDPEKGLHHDKCPNYGQCAYYTQDHTMDVDDEDGSSSGELGNMFVPSVSGSNLDETGWRTGEDMQFMAITRCASNIGMTSEYGIKEFGKKRRAKVKLEWRWNEVKQYTWLRASSWPHAKSMIPVSVPAKLPPIETKFDNWN